MERATSLARRDEADVCDRSRRTVLNWAGATLAGAAALDLDPLSLRLTEALAKNGLVDLGSGDVALLHYAYALEQLEAAFYTAVMASPYSDDSIRAFGAERCQRSRDCPSRVLSEGARQSRVPELGITFPSVDFGNRGGVLRTASMFEDLGVSAYNGAGALLTGAEHVATLAPSSSDIL